VPEDYLDGTKRNAGAGCNGQACAAHCVAGGPLDAYCFEGFGEEVVGADAFYMLFRVVCGWEEPG